MRNRDFVRRCYDAMRDCPRGSLIDIKEIVKAAAERAPGGYNVSFRHAQKCLNELEKHPDVAKTRRKYEFWKELEERVTVEMAGGRLTKGEALARVLASSKPTRDCLSESYMRRLFHMRREHEARPRRPISVSNNDLTIR